MSTKPVVKIGWKEWLSLPKLGLHAIKAKIDSGATTSALHAVDILTTTERGEPWVYFTVQPLQQRDDILVRCSAPIVDVRNVSDSGGHRERRLVIMSTLKIGDSLRKIEMTLTNRASLSVRMLLGRSAMQRVVIDPTATYLLGRPKKILGLYKDKKLDKK